MYFIRLIALALATLFFTGCAGFPGEGGQGSFLTKYRPLCGNAYKGRSTLVDLGDNHPLAGADLLMIVDRCERNEVRMQFWVEEDRSRTWVLRQTPHGLHLSHDHRRPDGSEYPQNLYGGFADQQRGTDRKQFFPADERTILERPSRAINVWSVEFDRERKRYFYRLHIRGELRYEAEFNLARPMKIPRLD